MGLTADSIINHRNLAKVCKKCPRFFSDCKNNTKARSWPTMSTTTIVSCSTSLHRHFLDVSRHSIRVKTTSHTASPLPDMSGHFPCTNPKPKKWFNLKSIQHGFSQCCLPWIIMNLTHFQMFSMVPAAARWGCWWTPPRWPRWTAPAPRPRRRRWAPPTRPDPRPNQRPRPRQGWHLAISGCKGRMGSVYVSMAILLYVKLLNCKVRAHVLLSRIMLYVLFLFEC